jgi:hypothetical protein
MARAGGDCRLLRRLHADGAAHVFGNRGSSEDGLLDAISRSPSSILG